MIMIDSHNLEDVLAKKGIKLCGGLEAKKCFRPRRNKGWLCVECHREYMKDFMAKKRGGKPSGSILGKTESDANRVLVVDGYDFNQDV